MQKDLFLFTPPFTQLHTPYPATAYIKGIPNTKEIDSYQINLGIKVISELLSTTYVAIGMTFSTLE